MQTPTKPAEYISSNNVFLLASCSYKWKHFFIKPSFAYSHLNNLKNKQTQFQTGAELLFDINNNEVILPPLAEEYATMFARFIDTEYMQNNTFKKNFWKEFKNMLPLDININSIDQIDFTQIQKYLIAEKNKKAEISKDEKELINFMADRKGTPEWENASDSIKVILKRAGLNPQFSDLALKRIQAGQTMESAQFLFINSLLEAVGLTFADLELTETVIENSGIKHYIVEDANLTNLKKLAGI